MLGFRLGLGASTCAGPRARVRVSVRVRARVRRLHMRRSASRDAVMSTALAWGDMGRSREIWGDMGRSREILEIWGDIATP